MQNQNLVTKTHKVVGLYSGDTYLTGTLDECETYVAYEIAGSFKIVPIENGPSNS
jgi:hypothetical protein